MAFDTYTEIRTGADEVAEIIRDQRNVLSSHKVGISGVVSAMTALSTEYGPIVAAIDALVLADSTNPGLLNLQADIAELLSDFTALQTEASTLDALVNPAP